MAEKPVVEVSTAEGELSSPPLLRGIQNSAQDEASSIDTKVDENGLSFIEVSRGDISGGLYLENLRKLNAGKGMEKCILHNGKMITPQEFETIGGRRANKA